jgi:hypothetical protein
MSNINRAEEGERERERERREILNRKANTSAIQRLSDDLLNKKETNTIMQVKFRAG